MPTRWLAKLVLLALLVWSPAANAHFQLNLNVRIAHVDHRADGLYVYLRLPMPYLVADKLGAVGADGRPLPAPYTTNATQAGQLVHFLNPVRFAADPLGLGSIAAEGHRLATNGDTLSPTVLGVRVYRRGEEPSFATLAGARASLTSVGQAISGPPPYVGDSVVDVLIRYPTSGSVHAYQFSSSLDPGLPGQEETANIILDYGPGGTNIYRARGLLTDRIEISRSAFAAIFTFIEQGIRHILSGLDHVLFVVCLVVGAVRLRGLVERVTGFTIGHTVTLVAGFFGFVPAGGWFVPAVELGIALSILYAAYVAVRADATRPRDTLAMFAVTMGIGLLHGLGFSFVLHEILRVDSPDLWQSLIAFNVGVEFGQLAIILVVWPSLRILAAVNRPVWQVARLGISGACAAIAACWVFERAVILATA